jgi:hypothetical protein
MERAGLAVAEIGRALLSGVTIKARTTAVDSIAVKAYGALANARAKRISTNSYWGAAAVSD